MHAQLAVHAAEGRLLGRHAARRRAAREPGPTVLRRRSRPSLLHHGAEPAGELDGAGQVEAGLRDPRRGEVDAVEGRLAQVGAGERRVVEARAREVGAAQVRIRQVGLGEIGLAQA